ncbi:hypothetical protein T02_464 [Trichinella nativa]|uniref:Uncharacterized protein n=1 Tax=Trichinella nativa TaxID=6335 RepID=A0A0V1LFQ4_9BILA|nr:hypothetical protein T02_464 [Trichinella nativa]
MANDKRRWKLFVANRVKEIQAVPQLLETLRGYALHTRLPNIVWWPGTRWLGEEKNPWPELDINGILDQTEIEKVGRTSFLSITTSLRRNMEDVIDPIRHSNFVKL